ncbi:MAG TPA: secondary thiamine-phosphate synthase enzyme YjbQ [Sunxiuqinia sp.]|nr:secondary thiamine-phosphate synthase enzyme YjbQ [Sunxiuqinia sp.]
MIQQVEIRLPEFRRGFHLVTNHITRELPELPEQGLLHILIKHTSAGITINENADPSVRADFNSFSDEMVPENLSIYTHTLEGSDDMPAHLKSSIFGADLTIPITNRRLNLGTWQGIYLGEFRDYGGPRRFVLTIFS